MNLFNDDKRGLRLGSITELNLVTRTKMFYKKIQGNLECNDDLLKRIEKAIPTHTRCKIETWKRDDGWWHQRAKIWITIDEVTSYDEKEGFGVEVTVLPTYLWQVMLNQVLTEEEADREEKRGEDDIGLIGINFVYHHQVGKPPCFLLYLSGSKFEKKKEKENIFCVDMRMLDDKILESAIIFKLLPYDFEYLKPYHCDVNNSFVFPDIPMYYVPLDHYRKYSNWMLCGEDKRDEVKQTGIHWILEYHDFGEGFLPKLKNSSEM